MDSLKIAGVGFAAVRPNRTLGGSFPHNVCLHSKVICFKNCSGWNIGRRKQRRTQYYLTPRVHCKFWNRQKKNKSINLSDTNYSNENNWSCKQQNDNATEFLLPPWSDIVVWKLRQNQEGGEGIIPLPPFSSCN